MPGGPVQSEGIARIRPLHTGQGRGGDRAAGASAFSRSGMARSLWRKRGEGAREEMYAGKEGCL